MSNLAGEYVKQGKVDKEEAKRLLEQEFEKKSPDGHYDYKKTISDGIENSIKNPMRKFEVDELERLDVGKGKCYFTLLDVENEFKELYDKGRERGVDVGWRCAKEYMSIKLGTTTYVYALPYSGKTQWWNEILVNLSKFYGWKHAILSPETGTPSDIYAELTSIYVGKEFSGDFKMTEQERVQARKFIEKHFIVIDPSDKGLNIDEVFDQVDGAEREYGVKIHTITIDPWNELDMDLSVHGGREDKYLERVLTRLRQNAHSHNRHNCIITHVRDMEKMKDGDQRYYPVSSPNDVAGGRLWWRKGMQMISVYRPLDIKNQPLKDENGEPYLENETHIYVQKSKPKGVGKVGMFKLYYDFKKNKYYEMDSIGMKLYADNFWEKNSSEVSAITQNENFYEESEEPPF
jgi:twinkle protein